MLKVSASTNPPKEENLIDYIKELSNLDVDYIHCDMMDGMFVKSKCLDVKLLKQIRDNTNMFLDCHIMYANPEFLIDKVAECGANIITVHYESFDYKKEIIDTINKIKSHNCIAGLSIKPNTKLTDIYPLLQYADMVLIMSVEPGKSGQSFIPKILNKIGKLSDYIRKHNLKVKIEVDGGINTNNSREVEKCGADIVVLGSVLFNSKNKAETIKKIKGL